MNIRPVLPILLTIDVAYLLGAIVGDGTVYGGRKSRTSSSPHYRVSIYASNVDWLNNVCKAYHELLDVHPNIRFSVRVARMAKQGQYAVHIVHKSWHRFLTDEMNIPSGKKSGIVRVPVSILRRPCLHAAFLSGYFDSDGGVSGRTIGWTSASKQLLEDVSWMLSVQGVRSQLSSWTHKNGRSYFVLRVHRSYASSFLNELCLLNTIRKQKCFLYLRMCRSGQTGRS